MSETKRVVRLIPSSSKEIMHPIGRVPPLLLALLLAAGCGDRAVQLLETPPSSVATGTPAPRYAAMTLAGDTLRLEAFRGDVVLLNAWATWCYPCVTELPVLQQLHERFGPQGLRVLGISIDRDEPEAIQRFLETHGVTYCNLKDRQWNLTQAFRWGVGIPKSLLIDRDGRIALFWSGGVNPTSAEQVAFLADTVAALLRAPAAPVAPEAVPPASAPSSANDL